MSNRSLLARLAVGASLATTAIVGVPGAAGAQSGVYYEHQFYTHAEIEGPNPSQYDIEQSAVSGDGNWAVSIYASLSSDRSELVAHNWRTHKSYHTTIEGSIVSLLDSDSISFDGSKVAFSTASGAFVHTFPTGTRTPMDVARAADRTLLSPDGALSVVNGGVFDTKSGSRVADAPTGFLWGFHSDGSLIVDTAVDATDGASVILVDPVSGALRASLADTAQICSLGVGTCNYAVTTQLFGFSDDPAVQGFRFLDLSTYTSEDGLVFVEIREDEWGEYIRVVDIGSGYTTANATTLFEIMAAYDYGADQAAVLRLYQAFFDREPDVKGAKYWLGVLDGGNSLENIAVWMSGSTEFQNLYSDKDDVAYVAAVYSNVLGRDYDQKGYNYWLGLLLQGELTRSGVVHWITANQEFITNYPFML